MVVVNRAWISKVDNNRTIKRFEAIYNNLPDSWQVSSLFVVILRVAQCNDSVEDQVSCKKNLLIIDMCTKICIFFWYK